MMHAFAQFHPNHPHVQLVIAGRRDVFSRKLEKEASELRLQPGAVRFVDLPTDKELAALYKNAALFIFPSRIEGFGIPPLEALSYGTPVAASSSASLPEVLHDGARYFDPDDIEMLTRLMQDATDAPHRFDDSLHAGKKQVERFTWMKTAKQTLNVYNELSLLDR
jgi:glycosyltransferase involved in cell wall biosynthesis